MTKAALRTLARQRRRAFVADRGDAFFPAHGAAVDALLHCLPPGACVAGYAAMHSEADPHLLLTRLHNLGFALALPWIDGDDPKMAFRQWVPGAPLDLSEAKFSQPQPDAPIVTPDVILLPMLGFDAAGNRLGQGAGHYDRALALIPQALRIGLAWSAQAFDALPADPWDMPLDAMLTEREWMIFPKSRIAP